MIFANLEIEQKIQLSDKTRLSAAKSFITVDNDALTSILIKPGDDETSIEVFNSDPEQMFLDWEFVAWKIDIDATNNKIDFNEGGADLVATLSSGTYSLSSLLTETVLKLTAAGANTYTFDVDPNDKVTINSTGSFIFLPIGGENKAVSILPTLGFLEDAGSASSVTGKRVEYLTRRVTVIASDGEDAAETKKTIKVYSIDGDKLFSNDADLRLHEADILKYVPPGRNTFMDVHRRSQDMIMQWLDKEGYVDVYDEKFTKAAIVDIEEVRQWSTFITLRLISEGIRTAADDIWSDKAKSYKGYEVEARNRAVLRLDVDKDGKVDKQEEIRISTGEIYRL